MKVERKGQIYFNFEPPCSSSCEGLGGPSAPYQVGFIYYENCLKFLQDAKNAMIQQEMQNNYLPKKIVQYLKLLLMLLAHFVEFFPTKN